MNWQYGLKLSPGVHDVLPGWDWVRIHKDDPYPPMTIEITTPGVSYRITAKKPEVCGQVMRVNK